MSGTFSRLTVMMSTSPVFRAAMRVLSSGIFRNWTVPTVGVPSRQWSVTASSSIKSPMRCSPKLNGPVPMGLAANSS